MILRKNICFECSQIQSEATTRKEVIREIAELSKKHPSLENYSADDIYKALLNRENISTTGFGNGVAIPHCSLDNFDNFVIGILITKKGIDYKSIDGKKTKLFFFIIGSSKRRNKHIQILSSISRLLHSKNNVKDILKVSNIKELSEIILNTPDKIEEDIVTDVQILFHIFIQKEKYFNDILQILSEVVEGSISVIETANAGHFLHKLPLFSTFWTEESKVYSRIIIAVVNKKIVNNVIRRIKTIVPNINNESGVLITTSNIFYTCGSIDF